MISLALRTYARTWPALVAWFLAGWTVRLILLRAAGYLGANVDPILGQLVLPLAVLARLASYVGMFLVLRAALRRDTDVDGVMAAASTAPARVRRGAFAIAWANSLGSAILAFFVIYAAWGLVQDDRVAYGAASFDQIDYDVQREGTALDIPFSLLTVSVVVGAFVLRRLLTRFEARLPRWVGAISVYLEAVWVFIAVILISRLLALVPDWLASRRMFAWAVDGWAQLRAASDLLVWVSDGVAWIALQLGEVVAQPLAWLALAAIVLASALPAARRHAGTRSVPKARLDAALAATTARWQNLGPRTRKVLEWLVSGFLERWQPVATAARLIWGAGPITVGLYILAFSVLTVATEWLRYAIYHLLGPHDGGWWGSLEQPIELVIAVIVFPLQLCLVAAAFDFCVRGLDRRVTSEGEVPADAGVSDPAAGSSAAGTVRR